MWRCIKLNLRKLSFCGSTMVEQYNFMWFRLIVPPCRLFTKRKFHYIDLLGKTLSRCTLKNNCFLNLVKYRNTIFYVLSIHSTKPFHAAQTSCAQILQLFDPAQPFLGRKRPFHRPRSLNEGWGMPILGQSFRESTREHGMNIQNMLTIINIGSWLLYWPPNNSTLKLYEYICKVSRVYYYSHFID